MAKGRKARNARRYGEGAAARLPKFPPAMMVRPVQSMCIRYRNSSEITEASPVELTLQTLTRLLVAVSSETTSAIATPVFGSVRLKHIDFWASNTQTSGTFPSALESIRVCWNEDLASGTRAGNPMFETMSAYGNVMQPARLRVYPPDGSQMKALGWFSNSTPTTTSYLQIEVLPINSVMDIHFEYVLADFTEPDGAVEAVAEVTLSAAEVSGIYAVFPGAAGGFVPQGWEAVDIASVPLRDNSVSNLVTPPPENPAAKPRPIRDFSNAAALEYARERREAARCRRAQ
jgi:hypothetical protein